MLSSWPQVLVECILAMGISPRSGFKEFVYVCTVSAICAGARPVNDEIKHIPGWDGPLPSRQYSGFVSMGVSRRVVCYIELHSYFISDFVYAACILMVRWIWDTVISGRHITMVYPLLYPVHLVEVCVYWLQGGRDRARIFWALHPGWKRGKPRKRSSPGLE